MKISDYAIVKRVSTTVMDNAGVIALDNGNYGSQEYVRGIYQSMISLSPPVSADDFADEIEAAATEYAPKKTHAGRNSLNGRDIWLNDIKREQGFRAGVRWLLTQLQKPSE